ncbi:hypothetical protein BC828DRAFT_380376, partial [Blastocladiella britannica]
MADDEGSTTVSTSSSFGAALRAVLSPFSRSRSRPRTDSATALVTDPLPPPVPPKPSRHGRHRPALSPDARAAIGRLRAALSVVVMDSVGFRTVAEAEGDTKNGSRLALDAPPLPLPALVPPPVPAGRAMELPMPPFVPSTATIPTSTLADIVNQHAQYLYQAAAAAGPPAMAVAFPDLTSDDRALLLSGNDPSAANERLWNMLASLLSTTISGAATAAAAASAATGTDVAVVAAAPAAAAVVVAYMQLLSAGIDARAADLQQHVAALDLEARAVAVDDLRRATRDVVREANDAVAALRSASSISGRGRDGRKNEDEEMRSALTAAAAVVPRLARVHMLLEAAAADVARDLTALQRRRHALQFFAAAGVAVAALASGGAVVAAAAAGSATMAAAASSGTFAAVASAVSSATSNAVSSAAGSMTAASAAQTLVTVSTVSAIAGALGPKVEAVLVGPTAAALQMLHGWRTELEVCRMATQRAAWELDRVLLTLLLAQEVQEGEQLMIS